MAHANWEWTIHFQEKAPGLVRAKLDELRRQPVFDKVLAEHDVVIASDTLITGRGHAAHALVAEALKDVVYGWHVESGPPTPGIPEA